MPATFRTYAIDFDQDGQIDIWRNTGDTIGSVANFMYQKGILKSARNINVGLANLQSAVANDERYSPARFEAALKNFRATVGL